MVSARFAAAAAVSAPYIALAGADPGRKQAAVDDRSGLRPRWFDRWTAGDQLPRSDHVAGATGLPVTSAQPLAAMTPWPTRIAAPAAWACVMASTSLRRSVSATVAPAPPRAWRQYFCRRGSPSAAWQHRVMVETSAERPGRHQAGPIVIRHRDRPIDRAGGHHAARRVELDVAPANVAFGRGEVVPEVLDQSLGVAVTGPEDRPRGHQADVAHRSKLVQTPLLGVGRLPTESNSVSPPRANCRSPSATRAPAYPAVSAADSPVTPPPTTRTSQPPVRFS